MVLIDIKIKSRTANIAKIFFIKEEYEWNLKLTCTNCNYVHGKEVTFLSGENNEEPDFSMKCPDCKYNFNVSVHKKSNCEINFDEESEKVDFSIFATLECRGCTITGWTPREGIHVQSTSGTVFKDVDVCMENWMEYDEASKEFCSIESFEFVYEKADK